MLNCAGCAKRREKAKQWLKFSQDRIKAVIMSKKKVEDVKVLIDEQEAKPSKKDKEIAQEDRLQYVIDRSKARQANR